MAIPPELDSEIDASFDRLELDKPSPPLAAFAGIGAAALATSPSVTIDDRPRSPTVPDAEEAEITSLSSGDVATVTPESTHVPALASTAEVLAVEDDEDDGIVIADDLAEIVDDPSGQLPDEDDLEELDIDATDA